MPVQVCNNLPCPIAVQEIVGYLRPPGSDSEEAVPCRVAMDSPIVQPSERSEAIVHIRADLALPPYTVPLDLRLRYQRYDAGHWLGLEGPYSFPGLDAIIVQARPRTGDQVFISFKDPEDDSHAKILQTHLDNVGIKGYRAKDDRKFGTHIWDEKIRDAIHQSRAVAVIWTPRTVRNPKGVMREIDLASEFNVPMMLTREVDTELPKGYDPDLEYAPLRPERLHLSLAEFAEGIYRRIGAP